MTSATGHILRRVGLVVEAVGLLGILAARRGDLGPLGGISPGSLCMGFFVAGLATWLVGSVVVWRARKKAPGVGNDAGRPG